jgi:hypothetical protein
MDIEQWRQSPSLPEYLVSSWGRIMREPYEARVPNGGVRKYGGKPHYGVRSFAEKGAKHRRMILIFRGRSSMTPCHIIAHWQHSEGKDHRPH